jgi:hypothetical protein
MCLIVAHFTRFPGHINLLKTKPSLLYTEHSESRCALRLRYVDLVVSIEVAVEVCCCFTAVVKQRLKCNTGKVCNCLIQFLLAMFLAIEKRAFINAQRLSECTVYGNSPYRAVNTFH